MVRPLFAIAVLISTLSLAANGCRSCSSCHDYDGPVSDCECGTCGCGRAGSNFTGGRNSGCQCSGNGACSCESSGGSACGCGPSGCSSCGNGGGSADVPADGEYVEYE